MSMGLKYGLMTLFIAWMETWDGKLPEYYLGDSTTPIIPLP